MRKVYMILGCIACILLIVDIGMTVYLKNTATANLTPVYENVMERAGEWDE